MTRKSKHVLINYMKKLSIILPQLFALILISASQADAITIGITAPAEFVPGQNITINSVIEFALGLLLAVGVLAAVAFLIWGAIKWITSGGDKTKVDGARSTIVAAVIGLIVLLLSFVIINVVIEVLGVGGGIFDINIPSLNRGTTTTP